MPASTVQDDYYEILGLSRDADQKAIERAYRQLASKYHPDASRDPGTVDKFKQMSEAYAVLSDPEKRRRYDAYGMAGVSGYSHDDLFGGLDLGSIFGDMGGLDFGTSIFDRVFGRRRRYTGPRQGANIEVPLEVPLERVLTGGAEVVSLRRPQDCAACQGTGAKAGTAPRPCDACGGAGQHIERRQQGGINLQQITPCPACQGRGRVIDTPCPDCQGLGKVEREETLEVSIPPGIKEGQALRIPGRGHLSPAAGGSPGDLYVVVNTASDPRFERRGPDLWHVETIDIPDAVLGMKLPVTALDGEVTINIPPGTQPETVMRLHGQGLPMFGGGGRGNLYVVIRVHVPEQLNTKERTLYERLRTFHRKTRRSHHGQPDVSRSC